MIYKAMQNIQTKISETLTNAGLVDGIYLNREEIKAQNKVMFWRDFVVVKEGSEKDTYLVWHLDNVNPFISGDGTLLYTHFKIALFVRTKQYKIIQDIDAIEKACEEANIKFEYGNSSYDSEIRSYNYTFYLSGVI